MEQQKTLNNAPKPSRRDVARAQDLLTEDDEVILYVIRAHPFGLFLIYLETLGALAVLAVLVFMISPDVLEDTPTGTGAGLALLIGLGFIMAMAVMLVATYVYKESRLIITNSHIIQVLQGSLFAKKTSRLSMASVEDVTAEQHGFFATIFNFGTLYIETAGEQKNFQFKNCPKPNDFAEAVLDTRSEYIEQLNIPPASGHRRLDDLPPTR